jgi:hypothetical protein
VAPPAPDVEACPLADALADADAEAEALAAFGVADASPDFPPWSLALLTAATVK